MVEIFVDTEQTWTSYKAVGRQCAVGWTVGRPPDSDWGRKVPCKRVWLYPVNQDWQLQLQYESVWRVDTFLTLELGDEKVPTPFSEAKSR